MLLKRAFDFASEIHHGQFRHGGKSPYILHPMAVSALVLKFGGDETQAAAALVHDTISDPRATRERLAEHFSAGVAEIAYGFSDPPVDTTHSKDPWTETRVAYLEKLSKLDERTLLVVACEELHEVTDLLMDLRYQGASVWKRYPVHGMVVFWYFREVLKIAQTSLKNPTYRHCVSELARAVGELKGLTLQN